MYSQTEKQRYDGWYNNLAHPDWGSVGKSAYHNKLELLFS